jgi:hypothetical protein
MVSKTTKTRTIRDRKHRRAGSARKAKLANQGTTKSADELFKVAKADG